MATPPDTTMDETAKKLRLEELEHACREAGVPCTSQRRAILEAVLDSVTHPSANTVFEFVRDRVRGISKATVHRNLEILSDMGLITKTCHPGAVARYDARTDIHHHLICLRCNSVEDIDADHLNRLEMPDTSKYGFEVRDYRVQLRGLCRKCRERKTAAPGGRKG